MYLIIINHKYWLFHLHDPLLTDQNPDQSMKRMIDYHCTLYLNEI